MAARQRAGRNETVIIERRESGPTLERIAKSESHYAVGGDRQTGRVYHFHDSTVDRLYSRLTKSAGSKDEEHLRQEYIALQRYRHHWHHAGLEAQLGSVDLNRIFASDPGSMSGMAKSERQSHHRIQWRAARELLGHKAGIVVDNVVCAEQSLETAGYSIGYNSPYRAREEAVKILRQSARALAKLWGIG